MEKRYQVFVSSTYEDLKSERRQVNQALLELECLPAAMELFVATDDDQWTLIEEVIDLSDYYIVIVGGRYGSMDEKGISYTEREFDYAIERGIPVLAFVHGDPDNIPSGSTDQNDDARKKLDSFRTKVKTGRTVAHFESPHELGSEVSRALVRLIRRKPGVGWVRGDVVVAEDAEREILRLRAELAEAKQESQTLQSESVAAIDRAVLAQGDDEVAIQIRVYSKNWSDDSEVYVDSTITWNDVLKAIGPALIDEATEKAIEDKLEIAFYFGKMSDEDRQNVEAINNAGVDVFDEDLEQTLVHLRTLGLVESGEKKRTVSDKSKYLRLTTAGRDQLTALLAVRRSEGVLATDVESPPVPDLEDPGE